MKRKFVPVALAAVMAFNMAACDSSKPAEPANPDDGNAAPTEAADKPAETPADTPDEPVEPYTVRTKADGSPIDLGGMEIIIRDWFSNAETDIMHADPDSLSSYEAEIREYREWAQEKYNFKIEKLAYSSETDGQYTYYAEETNLQLAGYLEPSYWNTSAPTGCTAAYDKGIIINKQEGGYELPHTGGPGTRIFTILGSILILGAGALLWRRLRIM